MNTASLLYSSFLQPRTWTFITLCLSLKHLSTWHHLTDLNVSSKYNRSGFCWFKPLTFKLRLYCVGFLPVVFVLSLIHYFSTTEYSSSVGKLHTKNPFWLNSDTLSTAFLHHNSQALKFYFLLSPSTALMLLVLQVMGLAFSFFTGRQHVDHVLKQLFFLSRPLTQMQDTVNYYYFFFLGKLASLYAITFHLFTLKYMLRAKEIISMTENRALKKSAYEFLKLREYFLEKQVSCREIYITFAVAHSFLPIFKAHSIFFSCTGSLWPYD